MTLERRPDAAAASSSPGLCRLVNLDSLDFSSEARNILGMVYKDVASRLHLSEEELDMVQREMYWKPTDGSLLFVLCLGDLGAEVSVEIPEEYWGFKERSWSVH